MSEQSNRSDELKRMLDEASKRPGVAVVMEAYGRTVKVQMAYQRANSAARATKKVATSNVSGPLVNRIF